MITLIGGLHGTGYLHAFRLIFRENPMIGFAILVAVGLYLIYRYMNRK